MSLKMEIEMWVDALMHYDNNEFEESLKSFDGISETSKILFNSGVIHATLGEHDKAVECYQRAVKLDQYLAVAYFQQGVSNFLVGDFEEALANFNDTLLYLRGNTYIDYEQLGLKFKLYSCEVLFNRGLCYIYLQQKDAGMGDLMYAAKEKVTEDHDVIDEAIKEEAEGYTVFSIPVGVVYRPNSSKVKNLKSKDYLGKARLIAASDIANTFTGFLGPDAKRDAAANLSMPIDDRPSDNISFGASNLVKTGLSSRTRQQSEPPINRNKFPPTPPPDSDEVMAQSSPVMERPAFSERAQSVRNNKARNPPMPQSEQAQTGKPLDKDLPRIGTTRTASEPRGPPVHQRTTRSMREPPSATKNDRRLFMETTKEDIANYSEDEAEMHQGSGSGKPRSVPNPKSSETHRSRADHKSHVSRSSRRPQFISETEEDEAEAQKSWDDDADVTPATESSASDDEDDTFDMMPPPKQAKQPSSARTRAISRSRSRGSTSRHAAAPSPLRPSHNKHRHNSSSKRSQPVPMAMPSPQPKMPTLTSIRVKCHHGDDTRYLMLSPTVAFEDFFDKVSGKFGLKGTTWKVKVKDEEGDLITWGDSDDWEMGLEVCRAEAKREGMEMGKMEVWVQEVL